MPSIHLPEYPNLGKLRAEAKRMVRASRSDGSDLTLSRAQLAVARSYGFASWPRLKHHVELVNQLTWQPHAATADESPADRFCRLACLAYEQDSPDRRAEAAALLLADPSLVDVHIWAAAAANDPDAVQRHLATTDARRRGGPYNWSPLFYALYSRVDPDVSAQAALRVGRRLLAAGADPHEGYLWHGLPTPFTLLTGAFGEGEQGPEALPRHPHSIALAEMLLRAGADPNDGQALYNRMFGVDDDYLELLLRWGLGRGDGGPWRARLGDAVDPPAALMHGTMRWAVTHDQRARVALLIAHGADVDLADEAARNGNLEVLEMLLAAGAPSPALDPVDMVYAQAMAGRGMDAPPEVIAHARRRRPGFLVWAAASGRADAVRTLLDLGFDINARGRSDGPGNTGWETALHAAVAADRIDIVRLLLDRGADPTIRDARFDSTPAGWAEHFCRAKIVALFRDR